MSNGNNSSPREIPVECNGDYRTRNNNKHNNNNNSRCDHTLNDARRGSLHAKRNESNNQPQGAPLVDWRNGSPTICPSSVRYNDDTEDVRSVPRTMESIDTIESIKPTEESASNKIQKTLLHDHYSEPEIDDVLDRQIQYSIDSESVLEQDDYLDSIAQEEELKKPKIPDGGWGWMVVLASLVISMVADGVSFSFGLLYIEFLHEFGASKSKTAWIGSLFMAVPLLSGPIMSALVDRYGCRNMTIAGGLISGLGFVLSSFGNSIEVMYLTFGVIAGLGLGMCYVTAVVSIAYWFDKKRTLAVGLGACGTGIGTFVYAPMTTYFIEEYGWRGTCLLLAGTFFNMIVAGTVMRDPEWWVLEQRKNDLVVPKKSHTKSDGSKSEEDPSDELPDIEELRKLFRDNHVPEYLVQRLNTTTERSEDNTAFRSVVNLPTFVKRSEKVSRWLFSSFITNRNLFGFADNICG